MSWWLPHNFAEKRPYLEGRARVIKALRWFFNDRDFTEVDTPVLQVCPVMDTHIHAFRTDLKNLDLSHRKTMYLQTSPEFDMKKLLVAGMSNIYQICPVFRNAEGSVLHSPEFTILEWYRAGADYRTLMDDSVDILRNVADNLGIKHYGYKGKTSDPYKELQRISVCDAFIKFTKIDLALYLDDISGFSDAIAALDIRVRAEDSWDDLFHAVMGEKIEPYLGVGVPTILYDYPISMAALSRKNPEDPRFAERFELYVCGVELANAYSELTDVTEQRARYKAEMALKQTLYGETYPPDEEFFDALEYGLPESAGIALGIDRLVMLSLGADNINDVLWAPIPLD
ncbi:MAG: EF-P lysine aminoacylase GenX [Alphaproteobacteria bacterium]|nr:MAG: EF-P lysine aminoacylase GenX [Alphaproteobacteria bacterium]